MLGANVIRAPYKDPKTTLILDDLEVYVLAHNHPELTEKCLTALDRVDCQDWFKVSFIDNASQPSYEGIAENYGLMMSYYRNEENKCFSKANNDVIKLGKSKYILILNNDCYVSPQAIGYMKAAFLNHPSIGVVGAKLLYPHGAVQHCGVAFANGVMPYHFARGVLANTHEANLRGEWPAVTGACLMTRRDVFDKLNGLDEMFVKSAFEDIDYCLRAREKGYTVWYEPNAVAIHEESATYFRSGPGLLEARQKGDQDSFNRFRQRWTAKYSNLNNMTGITRLFGDTTLLRI